MLRRLQKALRHPVSRNVLALYWVQVAMFVLPLTTLPYLARVLEPGAYGVILLTQGFVAILMVFIDWGLGWTGIRSTAEDRTDRGRLSGVVQRVRGGQLLLAAASILIAAAAWVLIPTLHDHPEFLVLGWVTAVASALSPDWFFLGIERPRVTAWIQLGVRTAAAALTFVLVKDPGDAWIVMALLTGSAVLGLVIADVLMYRHVDFRLPDWRLSLGEVRHASTIFVGGLAVGLYTSMNVVLLGLFRPSAEVAYFGAAERLVRTSMLVLSPIGGAIIPRLTALQAEGKRDRARKLLITATLVGLLPALTILIGLLVFGPQVVQLLYGDRFVDETTPILRILAILIPVNVTGTIFGLWLMTLHKDKLIVRIVLVAGVANIVLGCLFTLAWGPIGMAWSVIAAEAVAAVGGFVAVRRDARRTAAERAARPPEATDPQGVAG